MVRLLAGLDAFRVYELPREPDPASTGVDAAARHRRLAALVSAYHAGADAVALGWRRVSAGGPVDVLAGGASLAGTEDGDRVVLGLPAGARARRLPVGELAAAMGQLPCWCRTAGITDGLLTDPDPFAPRGASGETTVRESRLPLDDSLLAVWHDPFGWLLLAEAVGQDEAADLAGEVADRLRTVQSRADSSPEYAVEARRLRRRHRELARAPVTGLWRVHLLAGGASPEAARRIAGLVCASADLEGLPYALVPAGAAADTGPLPEVLEHAPPSLPGPARSPFTAGPELLAALTRPPAREMPGLRFALRPAFDVTAENTAGHLGDGTDAMPRPGLALGQILDGGRRAAGRLTVPYESLNRHTFVCGATGSGKSQTVRALLEQATAQGLPWLVVEPTKAEYRLMAARLAGTAEVVRIRPGLAGQLPAGINPLEPAPGPDGARFPLQTHADLVRALFLAAFDADDPFPQVLNAALTRCYEDLGWDLALGEPAVPGARPRYPTLEDLQRTADQVVSDIGYGREITDNVRGFVRVRLAALRTGTTGRFLADGHPIDFARLLRHNTVVEIEDVGDDMDKAFLMGTVLIRLVEHLRLVHGGTADVTGLRHLTVFEEAHRLLRRSATRGPAAHAVEMIAGLLAEIRAYGEGLIIAEQIPAKLVDDVVKNTAVKIVHRLPAADDRALVGATMNLTDEQSQYLVTLPPGEAAVFTDGMDFPLLVRMPDGTAQERRGPSATDSPARLVASRSATCGPLCLAEPCTLRDVRDAQRSLDHAAVLRLWGELAVLAHLTGWTTPVPHPAVREALRGVGRRLLDCALSHAVDAAVAGRSAAIGGQGCHDALAVHVTDAIRARLDGDGHCPRQEPEWLAPPYRWCLVRDTLRSAVRKDPAAARHPRSAEWEETYGMPIAGDTCAEQLVAVQGWFAADQRDAARVRALAFGHSVPAPIEQAVGARRDDTDWAARLAETVAPFGSCPWVPHLLAPRTTRRGGNDADRRP